LVVVVFTVGEEMDALTSIAVEALQSLNERLVAKLK
jgi:hypothetical protein